MRRQVRRRRTPAIGAHRSFDPHRVGNLECDAWVAYYRHEWGRFLRAAVGLTRRTFGLSWPATVRGSWLVLRANQLWAPYPDNDPDAAQRCMERFYRLLARRHHETFDPSHAAQLEVEWWRVHRGIQRDQYAGEHDEPPGEGQLVDALAALYAHPYGVPEAAVRVAAAQRALAMRHSDRWVREGCDLASPLLVQERAALVRSYAALLSAVHRV